MAAIKAEVVDPARPTYVFSRLSPTLTKIVEYDTFTQYPFLYLIHGNDKLVLLDTGCGSGDLVGLVTGHELNPQSLPIFVVCSHSHFDHIGANWQFSGPGGKASCCLEVAFGGAKKEWTDKWKTHIFGEHVKEFAITKWLDDGELIRLDEQEGSSDAIRVIHTPGHTPDEIALYYAKERRLFVGDSFYQWQPIFIPRDDDSLDAFEGSVTKLLALVEEEEARDTKAPAIVMCCGHVDDFLPAKEALRQVAKLVAGIKGESIPFIQNTAFGMELDEYRLDSFSIGFVPRGPTKHATCCCTPGHGFQEG